MVARLEPENKIEVVLQGYLKSKTNVPIIIVGDYSTKYGRRIKKTYSTNSKIRFLGGIYGQEKLDLLRKYAKIYFHGHTVGGTNPSLLEAMASGRPIVAHENIFNKSVLQENGLYFSSESEIQNAIAFFSEESFVQKVNGAKKVIEEKYSWKKIVDIHIEFFEKAIRILSNAKNTTIPNTTFDKSTQENLQALPEKMVALVHFGRSGTGLMHSLIDAHPEISTLPSIYFSEYFND